MKLAQLIDGLEVKAVTPAAAADAQHIRICDLTEDSRTALPGSLFVARSGLKADGRKYIRDAVQAGAVAVLVEADPHQTPAGAAGPLDDIRGAAVVVARDVQHASAHMAERFYGQPSTKLKLVGVTGTNGKTTTTYLVWQLLNAAKVRCGLVGTVLIDDGREVAPASMTTPPAIEISRTLAEMVEAGCQAAALEVSSHSLHQKRVDALAFDAAVFTNLTGDHLDYHKTMEAYGEAKARLFEMLPGQGLAVVNADDAASGRMLRDCPARAVRARSTAAGKPGAASAAASPSSAPDSPSDVEIVSATMNGMELRLRGPWGDFTAHVPLIGTYNAMNVLQAVACCHDLGMEAKHIAEVLREIKAPPGRLEPVSLPRGTAGVGPSASTGPKVFVDYAHTDDALRNVLTAVRAGMTGQTGQPGHLWAVFGCGGDKDKTKRPRMGAAAAHLADRVVVTSDNPRSENPGSIVDQVLEGVPRGRREAVAVQVDRAKAILHAIQTAGPDDVVVIAGKGHETEQILSDGAGKLISIHFDDREVARAALADRAGQSKTPRPAEGRDLANGP